MKNYALALDEKDYSSRSKFKEAFEQVVGMGLLTFVEVSTKDARPGKVEGYWSKSFLLIISINESRYKLYKLDKEFWL